MAGRNGNGSGFGELPPDAEWFMKGPRVPYGPSASRQVLGPPCQPPCPPPPLSTLSPDMAALIQHIQALVPVLAAPIQYAMSQALNQGGPQYVQQPPFVTPPFNAKPTDLFAQAIIAPLGNGPAIAGAMVAAVSDQWGIGPPIPVFIALTGQPVTIGTFTVPEQERVFYNTIEFRGHDWVANGPGTRLQITRSQESIIDLTQYPETPKPIFVQGAARQTIAINVINLDPNAANLVEVRLSGYRYPVIGREESLQGTLKRAGISAATGEYTS